MTVQTAQPGMAVTARLPVRGFKKFVLGAAALAATVGGIGLGVALTGSDAATTPPPSTQNQTDEVVRYGGPVPTDDKIFQPYGRPQIR